MKAMQYTAFGGSEVLQLNQIEKPEINDDEVLIKIKATTVNPMDMKFRTGSLQKGMPIDLPYTPGLDVSGVVEKTGKNVKRIKVGDNVFGTTFGGTYTEYINLNENQITINPKNTSYEDAAALAIPLTTAYSVLVENGQLSSGQKVLIHGAGGGVGTIALQMAKAIGAYVIGTASGKGLDLIKKLGSDEVIDYKSQDFSIIVSDVDIVVDLVGGETQAKSFGVLKKGGKLLSTVHPPSAELVKKFDIEARFVSSKPSFKKLDFGKKMVEEGKIKTQIAQVMKLENAANAQDLVSSGGINGKIVLEIN
jgi:NADPH:quinone reductase-like Zn-dependent oxidoreductase